MNSVEEKFIEHIKANEIEKVETFLENNWRIKQVYDSENASAVMVSLKTILDAEMKFYDVNNHDQGTETFVELRKKQFKIYEALVVHGFTFGPLEDSKAIENKLDIRTRIKLRKINKTLPDVSLEHLTALISRSKLAHHTPDDKRSAYNQIIARTFEELNAIKWIEPILKVAANADDLRIVFDFHNDSIMSVDTTANENVFGVMSPDEKIIFIGAAKLLVDTKRFEVLGHLAHEIAHFAMQIVYMNNGKPYSASSGDQEKFELVNKACKAKKDSEEFIRLVYMYKPNEFHAELIVRVPHLLALYSDEGKRDKLEKVKTKFSELFGFFEMETLVDLERAYPVIEAKKKISELNELTNVTDKLRSASDFLPEALKFKFDPQKISVVESNCPQLTMNMIYQQHASIKGSEFSFILITHETLFNKKLCAMAMKVFNSTLKPNLAIDCGAATVKEMSLLSKILQRKNLGDRVVVVVNDKVNYEGDNMAIFAISHHWDDLTGEAQETYSKTTVNFQGQTMPLSDVLPTGSEALNSVLLGRLLDRSSMLNISRELRLSVTNYYIEREFLNVPFRDKALRTQLRKPYRSPTLKPDEFIKVALTLKVLLLGGDPVEGKSTEFKMLATRLKSKFPSSWVVFIELKQFVEAFEKDGKATTTFGTSADVVNFFCKKILKIENFEAAVFRQLFHQNRVSFLFDGFDEISPNFKQFNVKLAKAIKEKTENLLLISTRKHLEEELKSELNCVVYELVDWDKQDRKRWFDAFSLKKGLTSDQLKEKFNSAETLLTGVYRENHSPLLFQVAVEFSDEPDFQLNANLYSIYKKFVHKVIEDYVRKGAEAVSDVVELFVTATDIIAFHQRLAVKELLYLADASLLKPLFENEVDISNEKMARVGFVTVHDGKLVFVQQTFAEFFVVDLFAKNVLSINSSNQQKQSSALIAVFRQVCVQDDGTLGLVRTFADGFFETLINSKQTIKLQIIKRIIEKNFSKEEIQMAFAYSVHQGLYNTLQLIPVANDSVFDANELKDLWRKQVTHDATVLTRAAENQSVKFIRKLISLARTALDDETFEKIFFDTVEKYQYERMSILSLALRNKNQGVFSYFTKLPVFSVENPRAKKLFMDFCGAKVEKNTDFRFAYSKGNMLIHALHSKDDENIQTFLEMLVDSFSGDEVKCILKSMDDSGHNALHFGHKFTEKSVNLLNLLKETLTNDELRTMTLAKDSKSNNALASAVALMENEEYFRIMWSFLKGIIGDDETFKKVLLESTDGFKTILTKASYNTNVAIYQFVFDVYKSSFDVAHMRQILSTTDDTKTLNCWNYLTWISRGRKLDSCKVLWKYMQEIFTHNELSKFYTYIEYAGEADLTEISFEMAYDATFPNNYIYHPRYFSSPGENNEYHY